VRTNGFRDRAEESGVVDDALPTSATRQVINHQQE
jgi:hypothetical protein